VKRPALAGPFRNAFRPDAAGTRPAAARGGPQGGKNAEASSWHVTIDESSWPGCTSGLAPTFRELGERRSMSERQKRVLCFALLHAGPGYASRKQFGYSGAAAAR